jgi:isoleucine--tRNA ligase
MDEVRGVCSAASSVRKANKLRNRLPLPKLTVALPESQRLSEFSDIIKDEVNVKELVLTDDVDSIGRFEVVVNPRVAGPRLGKDVQRVIKAVKAGNYTRNDDSVVADGITLTADEFTERLVAADPECTAQIEGVDGLVLVDREVTEALEAEGWAADVIRGLQDARKSSGFAVSDRIEVELFVSEDKVEWAERHKDDMAREVLATSFVVGHGDGTHNIVEGVTASMTLAS